MTTHNVDSILYPPLHSPSLIDQLDHLKLFLLTAPSTAHNPHSTPLIRFQLPNSSEFISCVYWSGLYHITGTDIVRALVFRFEAFGRPVRNMKKFEEGVFSDLRNLKPGTDACLEEPKSQFLELLFKNQCIRTQKKQKVFYWFSVPHDRLFLDALERDLKREKLGQESTTEITSEPALSFTYDPKRSLFEQYSTGNQNEEGELERAVREVEEKRGQEGKGNEMVSLFEGSSAYKQRKKKRSAAEAGGITKTRPSQQKPQSASPLFASALASPISLSAQTHQCPLLTCGRPFRNAHELELHLQSHGVSSRRAAPTREVSYEEEDEVTFPLQVPQADEQQSYPSPYSASPSSTPEHPWDRPHPHYYPQQQYSSPPYSTPLMTYSPSPSESPSRSANNSGFFHPGSTPNQWEESVGSKAEDDQSYHTTSYARTQPQERFDSYESSPPPTYYPIQTVPQAQLSVPVDNKPQLFVYTPFQFDAQYYNPSPAPPVAIPAPNHHQHTHTHAQPHLHLPYGLHEIQYT